MGSLAKSSRCLRISSRPPSQAFPPVLFAFGNPHPSSGVHTFVKTEVTGLGEDRAQCDLHQLVGTVCEPRAMYSLLRVQEVLHINWPKISQPATDDVLSNTGPPRVAVRLGTAPESLLSQSGKKVGVGVLRAESFTPNLPSQDTWGGLLEVGWSHMLRF
jgi:hypothetical protein